MAIAYERMKETDNGWVIETEVHVQVLNNTTRQDSKSVVATSCSCKPKTLQSNAPRN